MNALKKFESSTAFECRWSELFQRLIGGWIVVWEDSCADYQGWAKVLAYDQVSGRFCYVEWTYGSCSGCDPWEGLAESEVMEEIMRDAMFFNDARVMWNWIGMLLDQNDDKAQHLMLGVATLAACGGNPALA